MARSRKKPGINGGFIFKGKTFAGTQGEIFDLAVVAETQAAVDGRSDRVDTAGVDHCVDAAVFVRKHVSVVVSTALEAVAAGVSLERVETAATEERIGPEAPGKRVVEILAADEVVDIRAGQHASVV